MAMRIQTNVSALNAQRILGTNQDQLQKSVERLTSGFRINRSADDAAGLGIANKFRADARAMVQANRNAEQANSVLSIAEGAVTSVSSILDRMKELATQAASDTVTGAGRALIDQEFTQLRQEIGRVVSTTKFQGLALLDSNFGTKVHTSSGILGGATRAAAVTQSGAATGAYTLTNGSAGVLQLTNGSATQTLAAAASGAQTVNFGQLGIQVALASSYAGGATNDLNGGVLTVTMGSSGGQFMVGSSGAYTSDDMLRLNSMDLRTSATALNLDTAQLDTLSNAQTALSRIDSAIASVNGVLGNIGASQNRLDYSMQNTRIAINNTQAAESVVRDLDMAEEMTRYSKVQVLVQAGTSMLAQANATAQGALQLLR